MKYQMHELTEDMEAMKKIHALCLTLKTHAAAGMMRDLFNEKQFSLMPPEGQKQCLPMLGLYEACRNYWPDELNDLMPSLMPDFVAIPKL